MNLLPLSLRSSIIFVPEAIFIPEQITKYRFQAFLEISDKFRSNLNVFSYIIPAVLP